MTLRPIVNLRIVGAFELSLAEFTSNSFDASGQDSDPRGVAFNPDGTAMFIIGSGNNAVFQYSLGTGFDVSTASFTGTSFDVSGEETAPTGIAFNADGTTMFIIGPGSNASVFQYSLTTGFDVSTASFTGTSFDVSGEETASTGIAFNADGTTMFIIGDNASVFQYSLSTGFDVSTASFTGISFDVSTELTIGTGVTFNPDGTAMFVADSSSDSVFEYSLSTGFDVSTASFTGTSFDVSGQDNDPRGVTFNPDGTAMFIIGSGNNAVFDYLVGRLRLQE